MKYLNQKEKMEIRKVIEKNYRAKIDENLDFEIRKEKVYVFNKEQKKMHEFFKTKKVKVENLGIYFGKIKKNEKIQLSIEGSQIVGKSAKKNVLEINGYEELKKFLLGEKNLKIENFNVEKHNFPIVKYKNYIICSAASLENEIKSLFPKNARKLII